MISLYLWENLSRTNFLLNGFNNDQRLLTKPLEKKQLFITAISVFALLRNFYSLARIC